MENPNYDRHIHHYSLRMADAMPESNPFKIFTFQKLMGFTIQDSVALLVKPYCKIECLP
jgi:hypothetical protein